MGNLGNGVSISGELNDPEIVRLSPETYYAWARSTAKVLYANAPHYLPENHGTPLQFWVYIGGNFEVVRGHKQLYFGPDLMEAIDCFNLNAK